MVMTMLKVIQQEIIHVCHLQDLKLSLIHIQVNFNLLIYLIFNCNNLL